jgi:poly(3-hydroxyalkanoate) synthetase
MMIKFYFEQMKKLTDTMQQVFLIQDPPEWTTKNKKKYETDAIVLRAFRDKKTGAPELILPPQASHHSMVADWKKGQSLVETYLKNSKEGVYAIDWKPCTQERKDETIDDLVDQVLESIDAINPSKGKVKLTGLCQGGWLAAIVAARYPEKVKKMTLAAAPIDFTADGGAINAMAETLPMSWYKAMVNLNNGMMSGEFMVSGFKSLTFVDRYIGDYLKLYQNIDDEAFVARRNYFVRWYDQPQDLAGAWYLQAVEELFKENKLIKGELTIHGEKVDLKAIACPVALLTADNDNITLKNQLKNITKYISTPKNKILAKHLKDCGHIGVFIKKDGLEKEWIEALHFC